MAAVVREDGDQLFADFRGQLFQLRKSELLDIVGRIDTVEDTWHSFRARTRAIRPQYRGHYL